MIGATVLPDTDSITGGVDAQLFWDGDARCLPVVCGAEINNEYDDFWNRADSRNPR